MTTRIVGSVEAACSANVDSALLEPLYHMVEVLDQLYNLDGRCSLSVHLPGVVSQLIHSQVAHPLAPRSASPTVQCGRNCERFTCPSPLTNHNWVCPVPTAYPGAVSLYNVDKEYELILTLITYWLLAVHVVAIVTFISSRWQRLTAPLKKFCVKRTYLQAKHLKRSRKDDTNATAESTRESTAPDTRSPRKRKCLTMLQKAASSPTLLTCNSAGSEVYNTNENLLLITVNQPHHTVSDPCHRATSSYPTHPRLVHPRHTGYYHRLATARSREELIHSVLDEAEQLRRKDVQCSPNRSSYLIQTAEVQRFIENHINEMLEREKFKDRPRRAKHSEANCRGELSGESGSTNIEEFVAVKLLQKITEEMQRHNSLTKKQQRKYRGKLKCKRVLFKPGAAGAESESSKDLNRSQEPTDTKAPEGIQLLQESDVSGSSHCSSRVPENKGELDETINLPTESVTDALKTGVEPEEQTRCSGCSMKQDISDLTSLGIPTSLYLLPDFPTNWLNWPYPEILPKNLCTVVVGPRSPCALGGVLSGLCSHPLHRVWAKDT